MAVQGEKWLSMQMHGHKHDVKQLQTAEKDKCNLASFERSGGMHLHGSLVT